MEAADINNNLDIGAAADELKTAVATLCVVISEAARFTPVFSLIHGGWENVKKVSVTDKEIGYIKNWADLSTALLDWKKDAYKNALLKHFGRFSGIGISDGEQALAAVQLVLQVKRGLLALLGYLWGLLVKKLHLQEDATVREAEANKDFISHR